MPPAACRLLELAERKRGDFDFDIPPRQIRGKLAGEKLRVGAGDVDVGVLSHPKRVHRRFPLLDIVDFVEEEMDHLVAGFLEHRVNMVVQDPFCQETGILVIIEVNGENPRPRPSCFDFLLNQLHENGFPATPQSRDHFHHIRSYERADSFEETVAFHHSL